MTLRSLIYMHLKSSKAEGMEKILEEIMVEIIPKKLNRSKAMPMDIIIKLLYTNTKEKILNRVSSRLKYNHINIILSVHGPSTPIKSQRLSDTATPNYTILARKSL